MDPYCISRNPLRSVASGLRGSVRKRKRASGQVPENVLWLTSCFLQESTIGAAFLTKTIPDKGVKFEIW